MWGQGCDAEGGLQGIMQAQRFRHELTDVPGSNNSRFPLFHPLGLSQTGRAGWRGGRGLVFCSILRAQPEHFGAAAVNKEPLK